MATGAPGMGAELEVMHERKEVNAKSSEGPDGGNLTPKRQGRWAEATARRWWSREGASGGSLRCDVEPNENEAP